MLGGRNGAGTVLTWALASFLAQVSARLGLLVTQVLAGSGFRLLGCWRAWALGWSSGGPGLRARVYGWACWLEYGFNLESQ